MKPSKTERRIWDIESRIAYVRKQIERSKSVGENKKRARKIRVYQERIRQIRLEALLLGE